MMDNELRYWDSVYARYVYAKDCPSIEYFYQCYRDAQRNEHCPILQEKIMNNYEKMVDAQNK